MTKRWISLAIVLPCALAQFSCAVGGGAPASGGRASSGGAPASGGATTRSSGTADRAGASAADSGKATAPESSLESSAAPAPAPRAMPAARAGLRPEFRIFYDSLVDYGDWILIEPYGWVFRPDVNFVAWRPYDYGFWVPTDLYGWVWVSSEPFGWVTYHYGNWLRDDYQGWVWLPGADWGPAWVAWVQAGDYVGWAPLPPMGSPSPRVDPGWYAFVPVSALGSTDLTTRVVTAEKLGPALAQVKPIESVVKRGGVPIIRGPRIDLVERAQGRQLPRVAIVDPLAGAVASGGGSEPSKSPTTEDLVAAARQAAADAVNQARALMENKGPLPSRIPVVRPAPAQPTAPEAAPRKGGARPLQPGGAAADSSG